FEPQLVISRVKDLLAGKQPSGMWGSAPSAQGPLRQAPAAAEPEPRGAAPGASSGDSLEAYFDHLDAAFASSSPDVPAAPPGQRPSNAPVPLSRGGASAPASTPSARSNDPFADW